jgi:hypothetical protein
LGKGTLGKGTLGKGTLGKGTLGAADPGTETFGDLRHWLLQPQDSWLEALGLRPREWDLALDDFDPLQLDERMRSSLLRASLEASSAWGAWPGASRSGVPT